MRSDKACAVRKTNVQVSNRAPFAAESGGGQTRWSLVVSILFTRSPLEHR